ncbi:hypothetical protein [Vibrio owensii]|uniref:Uncharacterized protein n=1 Tax=Vibrio owensii CAIM 1854 = LMG 25443 TaxID=1229493 RepID=A0A0C1ZEE4_9VIBR|nr:hypothetical protein [Vibrio owensii]KIF54379.1 hypothetical protein H735_04880 [Vibrio owensii CAIM 1854 = LMG 25443]
MKFVEVVEFGEEHRYHVNGVWVLIGMHAIALFIALWFDDELRFIPTEIGAMCDAAISVTFVLISERVANSIEDILLKIKPL